MAGIAFRSLVLSGGATLIAASAFCVVQATGIKGSERPFLDTTPLCSAQAAQIKDSERPFLTENQRVMDKMMEGMAPNPTGDVDVDFAAMMIPHHQGAIDMAVLELRYLSTGIIERQRMPG